MDGLELVAMALAVLGTGVATNVAAAIWTLARRKKRLEKDRQLATEKERDKELVEGDVVRLTVEHSDGRRDEIEIHDRESLEAFLDAMPSREDDSPGNTDPATEKRDKGIQS